MRNRNNDRFYIRRLLASVILLSLIVSTALGRQDLNDWNKVKTKIGSPVAVIAKTGNRLDGMLISATDDSVKIEDQGRISEIVKIDVAEVRIKKKAGSHKAAWIGGLAAAGFGVGAAIGKAANPYDDSGWGSFGPLIGGAIGAAGGALTGAVVSAGRGKYLKEETIYKAP